MGDVATADLRPETATAPGAPPGDGRREWDLPVVVALVVLVAVCEAARWWLTARAGLLEPGSVSSSISALALATLGGLVVLRGAGRTYGWLMVATSVLLSTQGVAAWYAGIALVVEEGGDWPLAMFAAWYQDLFMVPWLFGFLLLPALFPNGRPVSPGWGRAVRITTITWIVVILAFMTQRRPVEGIFEGNPDVAVPPVNPTGLWAIGSVEYTEIIGPPWILVTVASVVIGIGSLLARWRRADTDGRRQIGLVAFALGLLLATVALEMVDVLLVEAAGIDLGLTVVVEVAFAVAAVAWSVALGLAVLRFRLYDVDLVVNRTIVYGILTAGVLATYVLVVVGARALVPDAAGQGLALGVAVVVALAFEPARSRVQAIVNRVMFGQRDEPYVVLSRLGDVVAGAGTPAETLQTLVDTVATSLMLPWVAIELDQRAGQVVRAEHGEPPARTSVLSMPLVHRDEEVGRMLAAPRSVHEPLGAADRQLLLDVARQAGAVAAAARLTLDLQRSREELVLAREEERRRIRRDLHDGLGPTLAAQTLALDAVADRVVEDPVTARDLLVGLKNETQRLVTDIRRLVHELRPPALDELGLAGALVAHVAQVDAGGRLAVRVRTDPDPLPDLSAAVEVAAWRIAREGLTNVLRHAEAANCTIELVATTSSLQVRVTDDGLGLPVVPRPGVGMRSMRERAEELGGTFSATDRSPGGTAVVATIPRTPGPGRVMAGHDHQEVTHG